MKVLKAYKLLRVRKDGTVGPLFINQRQRIPVGEWLNAEPHRTKGYAFRPGWHCTATPNAPHLTTKGRVWYEVRIMGFVRHKRPQYQGNLWFLAQQMKLVARLS
jgi:hypothetical protein